MALPLCSAIPSVIVRSSILLCLISLLLATSLAGQTIYVNPSTGSDVTGDGSVSNPYASLTHSLTQASTGFTIELQNGTYNTGSGEVFPIFLADQVDIVAAPGSAPTFDAGIATEVFKVQGINITALTTLRGLSVTGGGTSFLVEAGVVAGGLVLENCLFTAFTSIGANFRLRSGNHTVTIRNCDFIAAAGATHGIRFDVSSSSAALIAGSIEDCSIADALTSAAVLASAGGSVDDSFSIRRNQFSSFTIAGLHVQALAGSSFSATNSATVQGNQITGDNADLGEQGLVLEALSAGIGSQNAILDSSVLYNIMTKNSENVVVRTTNHMIGNTISLSCEFIGNSVANASDYGVLFDVAAGTTCAPDFGDLTRLAFGSGRNSFTNNVRNMIFDSDMQNVIMAQNNWWGTTSSTDIFNSIEQNGHSLFPSIDNPLKTSMTGSVSPSTISPNSNRNMTLTVGAQAGVVDNTDTDAVIGRILMTVGANVVVPVVFTNGQGLSFVSPSLSEGTYAIQIVNPGGQTLSATLRVTKDASGGGGSSTGICAVATAAHGDYESEEVRVLRRLRDDYLLTTQGGQAFTRAYYQYGPYLANYIEDRQWARSATRTGLIPLVALSKGLLLWNPGQRCMAAVGFLGLFFLIRRRRT
ncbi:MAG: DUF1565 domain-containing protein [Planctomycetota bacterium]|nr:MAG: DUF1565 domain-containing protein [Planctomycetota bacterium]